MHIATSSVSVLGFFADPRLHVIGSCECGGLSLLLLHHTAFGVHSICEIKNAEEKVDRCCPNYCVMIDIVGVDYVYTILHTMYIAMYLYS